MSWGMLRNPNNKFYFKLLANDALAASRAERRGVDGNGRLHATMLLYIQ